MIEANLQNFLPKLENDFPVDVDQVDCILPSVDSDGNIDFTLTFVPTMSGTQTTGLGAIGEATTLNNRRVLRSRTAITRGKNPTDVRAE
jgi:hypothetical protein